MSVASQDLAATRSRLVALEGGLNFRDIGGYRAGNRTVQWGKVYRAGVLCYFTSNDHPTLNGLKVRAICDLRRADEREREPTRWPDAITQGLFWDDGTAPTVRGFAASRPRNAAGMHDAMIELYRSLPSWMGPRIRGMFECIAKGQTPLVVHCAAGKDRTGVAIAVLLGSLGVDDETILADYLITNDVGNFEEFFNSRKNSQLGLGDNHQPLLSLPADMREVLFRADAAFLQAALDQIASEFGNMENYLKRCVGIDDRTIAQTREFLLE